MYWEDLVKKMMKKRKDQEETGAVRRANKAVGKTGCRREAAAAYSCLGGLRCGTGSTFWKGTERERGFGCREFPTGATERREFYLGNAENGRTTGAFREYTG